MVSINAPDKSHLKENCREISGDLNAQLCKKIPDTVMRPYKPSLEVLILKYTEGEKRYNKSCECCEKFIDECILPQVSHLDKIVTG